MERIPQQFKNSQEEIAFLREEIAKKEREMLGRNAEYDAADYETLARQEIKEYGEVSPDVALPKERHIDEHTLAKTRESVSTSSENVREVLDVIHEHGIRNGLTLLEKIDDPFVTDEVHRALVNELRNDVQIADLKEGVPPWQVLHMTLFEVSFPEYREDGKEVELAKLIATMEQFYAGMQAVGTTKKPQHYAIEIAVADKSDDIIFYVAVPTENVNLFEKQILSLYPHAVVTLQANDYNIFVDGGVSLMSVASLKKHPVYPIRHFETFDTDPLHVILNAFSKIERDGGGAAVQLVVHAGNNRYQSSFEGIISRIKKGERTSSAIRRSTLGGDLFESFVEMASSKKEKDAHREVDTDAVEQFTKKIERPISAVNIRIAASAATEARAEQIRAEIEAGFRQFENTSGNAITFRHFTGAQSQKKIKAFSFREYVKGTALPLSYAELATLFHFSGEGIESPQFKQSHAKSAPAPNDLPIGGTLLGVNEYRGTEREIYITEEDRLRHFYIIGQTGTGKSVFMKNLITQDIQAGKGVCMIDPHGSDIEDVLGAVPPEREQDVIYMDPSHMERVIGLNMLEYDPKKPEQKTFVVNELFSIFQRLYGANPEAMGPMFEQYFRNATQLVMEDPESGSTLLDISRVMSDAAFRRMKLERAKNPVVVQFWSEIANKAGGEASLENIVPYITSKFDVFTANDYMRPIIGQQESGLDFRKIMDERKILLVNLSKGRLGELNANLIGMIVVGKLLMAALSRVDDRSKSYPPFFLHIDEFQNVTTDSIASILSEARKYKLGLTVAHQFIAQLTDEIRDAVFGNVGSLAAFRVGSEDTDVLEKQFDPVFAAKDLMNIENYHAYVRVLANGTPTKPFSIKTLPPSETSSERVEALIEQSYERYGRDREEVEAEIQARYRKN